MDPSKLTRAQRRYLRDMERRLRELDIADERARAAGQDPYEMWVASRAELPHSAPDGPQPARSTQPRHPSARRKKLRRFIGIALIMSLPILAFVVTRGVPLGGSTTASPDGPPAGVGAMEAPIGEPINPPPGPDNYAFIATRSGADSIAEEPVTWDPCRPIHYVTSGIAPQEGQEILASAFKRVSEITGFKFVNDGPTSEVPTLGRNIYQPDVYGERWAPILVAWTAPQQIPDLAGDTIGLGGGVTVVSPQGEQAFVSGILFLDLPQIEAQLSQPGPDVDHAQRRRAIRSVMLHEIGHIMGLQHVGDPEQLMFPEARPGVWDFGVGDIRGLYRLATGPCVPGL